MVSKAINEFLYRNWDDSLPLNRQSWYRSLIRKNLNNPPDLVDLEAARAVNKGVFPSTLYNAANTSRHGKKWLKKQGADLRAISAGGGPKKGSKAAITALQKQRTQELEAEDEEPDEVEEAKEDDEPDVVAETAAPSKTPKKAPASKGTGPKQLTAKAARTNKSIPEESRVKVAPKKVHFEEKDEPAKKKRRTNSGCRPGPTKTKPNDDKDPGEGPGDANGPGGSVADLIAV